MASIIPTSSTTESAAATSNGNGTGTTGNGNTNETSSSVAPYVTGSGAPTAEQKTRADEIKAQVLTMTTDAIVIVLYDDNGNGIGQCIIYPK
jgi:hypothetical protein